MTMYALGGCSSIARQTCVCSCGVSTPALAEPLTVSRSSEDAASARLDVRLPIPETSSCPVFSCMGEPLYGVQTISQSGSA
jgi:hypothetical protein